MTAIARLCVLTAIAATIFVALPASARANTGGATAPQDGERTKHPTRARLTKRGLAVPPAYAPRAVKRVIKAGNEIAKHPYRYGGGHASWKDKGYDCSGSVSYALRRAKLVRRPMSSGEYRRWGRPRSGKWITVYANGGHMYMKVAGLRFDTSGLRQDGSRWHRSKRTKRGYAVRHPKGL